MIVLLKSVRRITGLLSGLPMVEKPVTGYAGTAVRKSDFTSLLTADCYLGLMLTGGLATKDTRLLHKGAVSDGR